MPGRNPPAKNIAALTRAQPPWESPGQPARPPRKVRQTDSARAVRALLPCSEAAVVWGRAPAALPDSLGVW